MADAFLDDFRGLRQYGLGNQYRGHNEQSFAKSKSETRKVMLGPEEVEVERHPDGHHVPNGQRDLGKWHAQPAEDVAQQTEVERHVALEQPDFFVLARWRRWLSRERPPNNTHKTSTAVGGRPAHGGKACTNHAESGSHGRKHRAGRGQRQPEDMPQVAFTGVVKFMLTTVSDDDCDGLRHWRFRGPLRSQPVEQAA